jgi:F420-0:gamma-glutamyl ligase
MDKHAHQPNPRKQLVITVEGTKWQRIPIKTHVITEQDDIREIVQQYIQSPLQKGSFLFISERVVAITQGRSYPIKDIYPSRIATFLVRFVHKSPYGIGLGSPWTMELAIQEVGLLRILFAAAVAAITKPFGVRGMFYRVAGRQAASIDGPCSYTLPPYNESVTLGPKDPDVVAKQLSEMCGAKVVIIDANDLGVDILGRSSKDVSIPWAEAVFKDNPLGQSTEQTPLCIVSRVD